RDLKFKKKKKSSNFKPLKEDEATLLIESSMEYKSGEYYPMMLTSQRTGLRVGELVALKWSDVNFDERLITVQRTFGRKGYSSPKNNKTRKVDMTPMLAKVLKQVQVDQKKWALQNRQSIPEFVFICDSGEVQNPEKFRYALNQCLKNAELRRIRIHDLRHTYATIRLLRGHNIGDVSYQLGHSSLSITYDIYGHWIPGRFKSEVDELDKTHQNAPYTHPDVLEK
ncbi:site-specific integrase, partial [bacterium]|nr:site-specific integrase [bacterium]